MSQFHLILAALLLAATSAGGVRAQSESPSGEAVLPPAAADGRAARDAPDIYLLPDESGQLRRVLGFRYEDFLKAWEAGETGPSAPARPRFSMGRLRLGANASGESAEVVATVEIERHVDGWIEVPLQLGALVLSDVRIEDGAKGEFVSVDADRRAYTAWLNGEADARRTIRLEGRIAVRREGEGRRLELQLPHAAESEVLLTGADGDIQVESPLDAIVSSERASDGGARTTRISGARGKLAVRWGPKPSVEAPRAAALEATVDEIVDVAPEGAAYEAIIRINSFDRPLDRVRIRLPEGATLTSALQASEYDLAPVPAEIAGNGDNPGGGRPVVEVRFHEADASPPLIRLTADRNLEETGANGAVPVESFEVAGAFRQHGAVAIRVSDQLHAHFASEGRIERIAPEELPPSIASDNVTAAFSAADQAWRLAAHVQLRQRRVRVTPRFDLHLGARGAAMDVLLDYQLSGGRTFDLQVDLKGWELTEQPIESGGAVDLNAQHVTPDGVLVLPLKDFSAEQIRVRFSLRREAGLGAHDLPIPEILDAFMLPGALNVTCDPSWRAVPRFEASGGVAPASDVIAPSADSADRQAGSLRLQAMAPKAHLAVEVEKRERQIEARSAVSARLEGNTIKVEQLLQYDVRHQPATEIAATVANDLLANEGLQLLVDGEAASATSIDILPLSSAPAAGDEARLRLVVQLPRPTLGRIELKIRSSLDLSDSQLTGQAIAAPLLAVPDHAAESMAVVSAADSRFRIGLWPGSDVSPWAVAPATDEASADSLPGSHIRLRATQPVEELPLRIESASARDAGDLWLDASWVQTWIAGGVRQDRAAFRFRATSDEVRVRLPEDMSSAPIETLLDNAVVAASRLPSHELVVSLPSSDEPQQHTLELRIQRAWRLNAWGRIDFSFPRLEGSSVEAPAYWQLVLPPSSVAVGVPDALSGEYWVGWDRSKWGRQPTRSQAELEQWTGAAAAPPPPAAANVYLYSAFDLPAKVSVHVVRRVWPIAAGAFAALAIGLVWMYLPIGRTAAFWMALAAVVAALTLAFPESAMLMGQAVLIGAGLTVLSAITRWALTSPRLRPSPVAPASSLSANTATTEQWAPEPRPNSSVSIASAPSYRSSGSSP